MYNLILPVVLVFPSTKSIVSSSSGARAGCSLASIVCTRVQGECALQAGATRPKGRLREGKGSEKGSEVKKQKREMETGPSEIQVVVGGQTACSARTAEGARQSRRRAIPGPICSRKEQESWSKYEADGLIPHLISSKPGPGYKRSLRCPGCVPARACLVARLDPR